MLHETQWMEICDAQIVTWSFMIVDRDCQKQKKVNFRREKTSWLPVAATQTGMFQKRDHSL
jgi:hypothetical protein